MLALFAYCIASVSIDRWEPQSWATSPVVFQGGENDLGFGQIVALFLIALPFLGLVEAFSGEYYRNSTPSMLIFVGHC